MAIDRYRPEQNLNEWAGLLHDLYGNTQNYSKSPFEVLSHLIEVCGAFGKHWFKKSDFATAQEFLPKMFAWAVALPRSVKARDNDLERMILQKFPGVCPYCGKQKCECSNAGKPSPDQKTVRDLYFQNAPSIKRSLSDFELMFKMIYGHTWRPHTEAANDIQYPFLRLIEELAELGEAVRFHHLYPENFENELADFFAWWFAVSICFNDLNTEKKMPTEALLWSAYPAQCLVCNMMPCFCRPGPVRALMSKPAPGHSHRIDTLTSLHNQGAYKDDLNKIESQGRAVALPISCVRIDLDDFKSVNDRYGHPAGDAALVHVAAVLRGKARERDQVYRIGGDEFGIIFSDFTEEEAYGLMRRVYAALDKSPVRYVSTTGERSEFSVGISAGIAECHDAVQIKDAFELADKAAYRSKEDGKGRVTRASVLRP